MKSAIGLEAWLLLSPFILMNSYSAAQSPQPQLDQQLDTELPALLRAKPVKEDPKDDKLHSLLKERYNAGVAELHSVYEEFKGGRIEIDLVYEAGHRVVRAGVELHDKPTERVTVWTQYVELCTHFEKATQASYDRGYSPATALHEARYKRLDAEIQLLRAKREADGVKGK